MITGVCLNPCIDRTVEIQSFAYGGLNRILSSRQDAAGKGVNVARAAKELGLSSAAIGLSFAENAYMIRQKLENAGIPHEFAEEKGAIRVNLKVFDRATQRITEINEKGVPATQAQMNAMRALVQKYAKLSNWMVFTGSLPPDAPQDTYKTLALLAKEESQGRCRILIDAEGEKLRHGILAQPDLIKPNTYELELMCGRALPTLQDIAAGAKECVQMGAKLVAVSMGGDGALLTDGGTTYYAPCVKVDVRSTVGAGDCMVAGFLYGMEKQLPLPELLRCGAAAGTAAVLTEGTQLLTKKDFDEMLARVTVEAL